MTSVGVLPRSIAPLPDESITGFLLRLAHRLDISPARLMDVTGLHPAATGPARRGPSPFVLLTQVDPKALRHFARSTRLTEAEAAGLLLGGYAERYPPAAPRPDATGRRGARLHLDQWVLSKSTRYCPTCLAGDGSPLQTRHGGAWRRAWRLPVVFTCPIHHRYLNHRCPACDQPVHHRERGFPPRWWSTELHPAQCRATYHQPTLASGVAPAGREAFLTTAPVVGLRPTTLVLAAQQRLWHALAPTTDVVECLGRPTSPGRYVRPDPTQLHAAPVLAAGQRPGTHRRLGADVGRVQRRSARADRRPVPVHRRRCRTTTAQRGPGTAAGLGRVRGVAGHRRPDARPGHTPGADRSPAPSAQPRPAPARKGRLDPTLPHRTARQQRGVPSGRRPDPADLRPHAARPATARADPAHPVRSRAHRPVPATRLVPATPGRPGRHQPDHLRRTAALHLCQTAVGGSIRQAAVRLGLPDTTAIAERYHSSARAVHRWAKQRPDPYEFESAVHDLADELEASPHRIDYHQRRVALRDWCIDADTWAHLVAQLPDSPWPHRREPELGDRKRHSASIIVWARITNGEHLFAPHPLRDQLPAPVRDAWRLSAYALVARFRDGCTRPHDIDLDRLLTAYGTWLAHHIDATGSAAHAPWTERVDQPGTHGSSP